MMTTNTQETATTMMTLRLQNLTNGLGRLTSAISVVALLAGAGLMGCTVEQGGPPADETLEDYTPGTRVGGEGNPDDGTDPDGEDNDGKDPQNPEPDDVTPEPDDVTPEPDDVTPEPDDVPPPDPTMMESTNDNLVWKRYRAVERDLMRALELEKNELCNELGQFSCIDLVHLSPLGGNEPFEQGQYEPVAAPTATTPIANDRVVLSACTGRVDLDKTGNPEVFTDLDLNKSQLDLGTDGAAIDATTTQLYRRLLSRDPTTAEVDAVRGMVQGGPISAEEFAKAACYAIGTTAENFFY